MDNPFLALFEETPPAPPSAPVRKPDLGASAGRLQTLNTIIENAFLFTIHPYGLLGRPASDPVKGLVFLQGISEEVVNEEKGRTWLDVDVIGRAINDRLLMTPEDLENSVLYKESKKKSFSPQVTETRVAVYLSQCYLRICDERKKARASQDPNVTEEDFQKLRSELLQNLITAFIITDQDLSVQFMEILSGTHPSLVDFLSDAVLEDEKGGPMETLLQNLFVHIKKQITAAPPMILGDEQVLSVLQVICKSPPAAEVFIQHHFPKMFRTPEPTGNMYTDGILGSLLKKSCLPERDLGRYEFFDNVLKEQHSVLSSIEQNIWSRLDTCRSTIYDLFNSLMRCSPQVKHLTLMWLGDCFKANAGRGKLWTTEMGALMSDQFASDGFFLNLGDVLLRLCRPFTLGYNNPGILKIDPTYTSQECVVADDSKIKNVHLREANKETCFLPRNDDDEPGEVRQDPYNFITDIFFLAHKAQDLGFRVCHEKLMKLNQELARQQQIFRELQVAGVNDDNSEAVQKRMEILTQKYLTMKAALLVPSFLENMMLLNAGTASWMVQLSLRSDEKPSLKFLPLKFPLNHKEISPLLKYIPEFVLDNIIEHILLAKRFNPMHLEEQGEYLGLIFEMILVFMGSRTWVKNPHLRAKLAECLEALLPRSDQQGLRAPIYNREQLFTSHQHRFEVVSTLLHVFVDIEMTGQSVQFEMKFNYRRPMYEIIKYLWETETYKQKFSELADYAELHINDEDAPLFLRFVNLLINDAIYLLDEALNYMKQIQQYQEQQPGWQQLPQNERTNNEQQYNHTGRLARFHNIMGLETIQVLNDLTTTIRSVFTHPAMVDRIAAMLNYFLKNLVGPERKSFKVKNLDEYSFKPGEVVTGICKIYVNLAECQSFLASVSQDGRSYSHGLFSQAEEVLIRIGHVELVSPLQDVAEKIRKSAENLKADEEMFSDAPDHFLDAIMSILMRDPVKLPASGQVVDRSTIARHLLSDQNDPFTRAPLTMDMVIPQPELKLEIEQWISHKRGAVK